MKSFKTYLLENNLSVLLEYKEWHQLVKQFGDKIIDQFKFGYEPPSTSEKDTVPHKTEFIKTQLGLHDIPKHHGRWILNQVIKGKISNHEDIASTVIPNLSKFEEAKDRHNINLSKVNDQTELFNIVQKHAPEESPDLDLKQGEDYTLHGENEHWKVIQPHNEKTSCAFGSNTNWCTASKSNNRYKHYTEDGSKIHILIPKKPLYKGEKYQHHPSQFMDHDDIPVNTDEKPQLSLVDRPLPQIDENLKFDLEFQAGITNKNTPEKDLLKHINHPNFGSRPGHISHAIQSPHESVAKAALAHPNFGSDIFHIEKAVQSSHESVAKAALAHPNFGSHPYHIESALRSRHESVAKATTAHANFGNETYHISQALESPHESVAKAAIAHPKFGSHIYHLSYAVQSPHESVAKAGLAHPAFGRNPQHISYAVRSPHESVAKAALAHPNFGSNPYNISYALQSPHEFVAKAAMAHSNFGRHTHQMVQALQSSHESVAKAALAHPNFGSHPDHISHAIQSSHESVAKAALAHPNFGNETYHISQALESPHESVVNAAKEYQSKTTQNTVNESLYPTINKILRAST